MNIEPSHIFFYLKLRFNCTVLASWPECANHRQRSSHLTLDCKVLVQTAWLQLCNVLLAVCDGLAASDLVSSWLQGIRLIRRGSRHLNWWQCCGINGTQGCGTGFVCVVLWLVLFSDDLPFRLIHALQTLLINSR